MVTSSHLGACKKQREKTAKALMALLICRELRKGCTIHARQQYWKAHRSMRGTAREQELSCGSGGSYTLVGFTIKCLDRGEYRIALDSNCQRGLRQEDSTRVDQFYKL